MTSLFRLLLLLAFSSRAVAAGEPIPILTYHRFDAISAHSATVVVTAVFAEQMTWLEANHYRVIPLRRVVDHDDEAPGPKVAITADDGYRSVYTEMFPIIRRNAMPITVFINPAMIGGGAYLTWAQLAEMRASGLVDIEAHTQTHPNFTIERAKRSPDDFRAFAGREIAGSREALRQRLGTAPDLLAWPYGIHGAELEAAARTAGFTAAFALGSRAARPDDDPFALPRYQVYNNDRGAGFAALAEGRRRK